MTTIQDVRRAFADLAAKHGRHFATMTLLYSCGVFTCADLDRREYKIALSYLRCYRKSRALITSAELELP